MKTVRQVVSAVIVWGGCGIFGLTWGATPTENVQAALDRVFPGWTTSENAPDGDPGLRLPPNANGSLRDTVMTHPLKRGDATLSRRIAVPTTGSPCLRVLASAHPSGDWTFEALVGGERVAVQKVTPDNPLVAEIPLVRWAGRTVTVALRNRADGWNWEPAYWHQIDLVDSEARTPLTGSTVRGAKLTGHVGEAMERQFNNAITKKDADILAAVFGKERYGKSFRWSDEYWGKWLMTAVNAWLYTGNDELKAKIDRTVDFVLANQHPDGYLGDLAPKKRYGRGDWEIWCRKYLLFGFIEHYEVFKDPRVLKAACRLADELMTQVGPGKLPIATAGTHHGFASMGISQAYARLHALTGDERYRAYCAYIVDQMERGPEAVQLVSNALAGKDVASYRPFNGIFMHWDNAHKAFEFTSCYVGMLDYFRIGGAPHFFTAARKAAENIARTEIMVVGSGANYEQWFHGASKQTLPMRRQQEGCTKTLWMHFCRELLETTGDARWADEFERTFFNTYLAALSPDGSRFDMYVPLAGRRGHDHRLDQGELKTHCCNELGPHGFVDLLRSIALTDGSSVYVAQYVPGRVTVPRAGGAVEIVQETDYPATGKVKVTVNPEKPGRFALKLRIPGWLDGRAGWKTFDREWKRGDSIEVEWPLKPRMFAQNGHLAFTVGPIVLARDSRYGDGDIDEPLQLQGRALPKFVVDPAPHPGRWISYTASFLTIEGLNGYDDAPTEKTVHFCDFASSANTWSDASRCRVWIPEPYIQGRTR